MAVFGWSPTAKATSVPGKNAVLAEENLLRKRGARARPLDSRLSSRSEIHAEGDAGPPRRSIHGATVAREVVCGPPGEAIHAKQHRCRAHAGVQKPERPPGARLVQVRLARCHTHGAAAMPSTPLRVGDMPVRATLSARVTHRPHRHTSRGLVTDARCGRLRRWADPPAVVGRLNQRRLTHRQAVRSQPSNQLGSDFRSRMRAVVVGGCDARHEVARPDCSIR